MSVLKVAVASVLALSLVLGLALPALAAPDEPFPWTEDFQARIVKGEVTYVDEEYQEYFEIKSGEDEISIRVDENTRYFVLGAPGLATALAQQFRLRNQAEFGTPGEQGLRLRLQNQAEVGAQEEQCMGLGLQNQQRVRAEVWNQARLRVQSQVAQTETVSIELQPARLRLQNRVAQTETVPLGEPQPARVRAQNQLVQMVTFPLPEPQPAVSRPLGGKAEFSDIEVGDRVAVWLADGENLARWVLIIKPATRAHVGGTITGLTSETITIAPDGGEAVTLGYNEDTVFVLNGFTSVEVRQLARAVYDSENMLAKRVVVYLPD
jgi:hypothetical protein